MAFLGRKKTFGVIRRINRVTSVQMPLKFYEDRDAFKLFIIDVGLMGAMADVPDSQIMVGDNILAL